MKLLEGMLSKLYFLRVIHQNGWVNGVYKGYRYDAKVYDTPSQLGIDGGRISKLRVKHQGEVVADYDRGWSVLPLEVHQKTCEEIKQIVLTGRS